MLIKDIIAILFIPVAIIGLILNLLIFYIIFRFSIMKNVTNIYTINLIIANLLYIFWIPFFITEEYLQYWPFGLLSCKLHKYFALIAYTVINLLVTIISIDRYLTICHSNKLNHLQTYKFSQVICILIWLFAFVLRYPMFKYTNINDKLLICNIQYPYKALRDYWFYINSIFGFLLTCSLILFIYFLIIIKLRKVDHVTVNRMKIRSHFNSTNLTLMITLLYLLSWSPFWFVGFAKRFLGSSQVVRTPIGPKTPDLYSKHVPIYKILINMSLLLGISYSAFNPIIFIVYDEKFNKCFKNIFNIGHRKHNPINNNIQLNVCTVDDANLSIESTAPIQPKEEIETKEKIIQQ